MCSTRGGSQEMYITFASAMQIRQNPEETSPEIQNRGTSGPKIGHVNVSDNKTLKKKPKQKNQDGFMYIMCGGSGGREGSTVGRASPNL